MSENLSKVVEFVNEKDNEFFNHYISIDNICLGDIIVTREGYIYVVDNPYGDSTHMYCLWLCDKHGRQIIQLESYNKKLLRKSNSNDDIMEIYRKNDVALDSVNKEDLKLIWSRYTTTDNVNKILEFNSETKNTSNKLVNFLNELGNNKLHKINKKIDYIVPELNFNNIVVTRSGEVYIVGFDENVKEEYRKEFYLLDHKGRKGIRLLSYNDKLKCKISSFDIMQIYTFSGTFTYNTDEEKKLKSLVEFKEDDITLIWERPNEE